MGSWKMCLVSQWVIFHFHDGRKGKWLQKLVSRTRKLLKHVDFSGQANALIYLMSSSDLSTHDV